MRSKAHLSHTTSCNECYDTENSHLITSTVPYRTVLFPSNQATIVSHLGEATASPQRGARILPQEFYRKTADPVLPISLGTDLVDVPRPLEVAFVHHLAKGQPNQHAEAPGMRF